MQKLQFSQHTAVAVTSSISSTSRKKTRGKISKQIDLAYSIETKIKPISANKIDLALNKNIEQTTINAAFNLY